MINPSKGSVGGNLVRRASRVQRNACAHTYVNRIVDNFRLELSVLRQLRPSSCLESTMIAKDKELIDRAFHVALLRQHEELKRGLRQLVNDAAGKGRLGLGPFHSQIADLFISAYRERGECLWSLTNRILSTGDAEAEQTVPDEIKQFLQERLAAQWQELENELDKALKPMNAMPGLLGRLGEAHQHLRDDLFVRVDLAVREASARAGIITVNSATGNLDAAARDGLTNLLRREMLDGALPIEFGNAETSGMPLSVVMLDIDHFKAVNDGHGHPKGDEVLRQVADCVRACVSGKGEAYRYGGEEITVVLPNHEPHEAIAVAERVRSKVQASRPGGLEITASLGVASFPVHASSLEELIRFADAALYDAKHRGRNLVRAHGDGEPVADTRTPDRREPTPGGLSSEESFALRKAYFTSRVARCPRDGAMLDVLELAEMGVGGAAAVRLRVWCKLCGLQKEI